MTDAPALLVPSLWVLGVVLVLTSIRCCFSNYKRERWNYFMRLTCFMSFMVWLHTIFVRCEPWIASWARETFDKWKGREEILLITGGLSALFIFCFF